MVKHQILISLLLVTCVSAGLFGSRKDKDKGTNSVASKIKTFVFGSDSEDDEDEYEEKECNYAEEEDSRIRGTIDAETLTKMADVNNYEIPVLSLDDQVAIVDKGIDFRRPFDVRLVTKTLTEVIKEKLPADAPPMTPEEVLSVKDAMEKTADPEASKAIAEEKKEASAKKKTSTVQQPKSDLSATAQTEAEPSTPSAGSFATRKDEDKGTNLQVKDRATSYQMIGRETSYPMHYQHASPQVKDKETSSVLNKVTAAIFGSNTDDVDEYEEKECNYAEEEDSRIRGTIDGEVLTKMADENNHEFPVLSLDDQVAVVDKGVDFRKPFDVNKVKKVLAEVVREKLPEDAPLMTTEEILSVKDTMEIAADPEASKVIAEEKKKEAFAKKTGTSTSRPGFVDTVKVFVGEAAQKVREEAKHFQENLKQRNVVGSSDDTDDKPVIGEAKTGYNEPGDGGEASFVKTGDEGEVSPDDHVDGGKSSHDEHAEGGNASLVELGDEGEGSHDEPADGHGAGNDEPVNGGKANHDEHTHGAKASFVELEDEGEVSHDKPADGHKAGNDEPANGGKASHDEHTDDAKASFVEFGYEGEGSPDEPVDGHEAGNDEPANGGKVSHDEHTDGAKASLAEPGDKGEVSHEEPADGHEASNDEPADGGIVGDNEPVNEIEKILDAPADGGKGRGDPADGGDGHDEPIKGVEAGHDEPADGGEASDDVPAHGGEDGPAEPVDGGEASRDEPGDGIEEGKDASSHGVEAGHDERAEGGEGGHVEPAHGGIVKPADSGEDGHGEHADEGVSGHDEPAAGTVPRKSPKIGME